LAEEVFGDLLKLKRLNALVHGAVKQDILRWRGSMAAGGYRRDVVFVETALLKQSGLAAIADGVWEVTAPIETRVLRAMKRDNSDRAGIEARIRSQEQTGRDAECRESSAVEDAAVKIIDNDGVKPVLPQVLGLLGIG
ncbi:MAG: dephospho-CoA kinase, partial [Muribaculaceae bacterium]|nr:dephospho-CoA kinase [Muribaculaceae bacterium]